MHINNKHFGLVLALVAFSLMGCYSRSRTRAAHAERTPFTSDYDSDSPADSCEERRRLQRASRRAEYCEAGVEEACISRPATAVDALASIEAVCLMDLLTPERCAELRASIPHGTDVEIPTPAASAGTLTMLSPEGLQTYRFYTDPIIWDDIEGHCASRSIGYAGVDGTLGATSGGSTPFTASVLGIPLVGGGSDIRLGVGVGGGAGGTSYPVRSTLPRNWYAQFQITAANTGAMLASGAVGNVAAGTAIGLVPTSMTVPLPVTVGTPITITWACVDATGTNPSVTNSITGPVGIGFDINPDRCGLRTY